MLFIAMVVYLSRVGVDDGDGGLPPDLLVGHGRGGGRYGWLPGLPCVVGRGRDGAAGAAGLAGVRVVHAGVGRAVVRGGRGRARRVRGHAAGLLGVRLLLLGRDPVRRGLPLRHLGHGDLGWRAK